MQSRVYEDLEAYLDDWEDQLYCEFLELGMNYELDSDFEDFCEERYFQFLKENNNGKEEA